MKAIIEAVSAVMTFLMMLGGLAGAIDVQSNSPIMIAEHGESHELE